MNASAWYLHLPIHSHSQGLLNDRQRTERAMWLASLRAARIADNK